MTRLNDGGQMVPSRLKAGTETSGLIPEIKQQIQYFSEVSRKLGLRYAFRFRAAMLGRRLGWHSGESIRLHPSNLLHPIDLRLCSTDADVYEQVLRDEQYAIVADSCVPEVIVDCGANVGYTSAYFLSRFPRARVLAIEPFPASAELCRRNLLPYGERATVIEAAIWSHCTRLTLDPAGDTGWGARVRSLGLEEQGEIEAIDLPSLGLTHIDILKIDIEGSETELFAGDSDRWLPSVSNIAIELHGPECERSFRRAMAHYSYIESQFGELTICRNIALAG